MVDAFNLTQAAVSQFSLTEGILFLKPLIFFIIGITIYSIFVFKFYRFIASKEIFSLKSVEKTEKWAGLKKGANIFSYMLKHLVAYPMIIFFYYIILMAFFVFLAEGYTIDTVMLIAMSLVASIRISAYYDEALSVDLAKLIPFALLAVFLIDIAAFSLESSIAALMTIPMFWKTIVYYLLFIVGLEIVLRTGYLVLGKNSKNVTSEEERLIKESMERIKKRK